MAFFSATSAQTIKLMQPSQGRNLLYRCHAGEHIHTLANVYEVFIVWYFGGICRSVVYITESIFFSVMPAHAGAHGVIRLFVASGWIKFMRKAHCHLIRRPARHFASDAHVGPRSREDDELWG
ncbi:MAG: hypothetical protein ACR2O4_09880 [Hyphomicrobiaceae bacterium]